MPGPGEEAPPEFEYLEERPYQTDGRVFIIETPLPPEKKTETDPLAKQTGTQKSNTARNT